MALGASRGNVTTLVLRQALRLAAAGIALGVVFALGTSQLLSAFAGAILELLNPRAYAGGVLVVLAACLVGAWIPSRRATMVDPATTMRND
jgi:ABC-type antimicrobial peptide transport system permease subunit